MLKPLASELPTKLYVALTCEPVSSAETLIATSSSPRTVVTSVVSSVVPSVVASVVSTVVSSVVASVVSTVVSSVVDSVGVGSGVSPAGPYLIAAMFNEVVLPGIIYIYEPAPGAVKVGTVTLEPSLVIVPVATTVTVEATLLARSVASTRITSAESTPPEPGAPYTVISVAPVTVNINAFSITLGAAAASNTSPTE